MTRTLEFHCQIIGPTSRSADCLSQSQQAAEYAQSFLDQILATCAFLIVMAMLLVVRVWLPPTFNGIDPEGRVSRKYQLSQDKLAMNGHQLQTEQTLKNASLKPE